VRFRCGELPACAVRFCKNGCTLLEKAACLRLIMNCAFFSRGRLFKLTDVKVLASRHGITVLASLHVLNWASVYVLVPGTVCDQA